MSTTSTPEDRHDALHALAGDYVLGTLPAARRREVESRMALEPALRVAVEAWEARLLPLTVLAPPVEPSAPLWERIARSVDAAEAARAPARPRRDWWGSLSLWRGLAGAGFAAAAILATVLARQMALPPAAPQYLVVLVAPQDKAPGWVVQARSPQSLDLIPLAPTAVPPEKTLQFWTKADGWSGPKSLGLVQPGQVIQVPLDQLPPLQPNQLFELTLEPAGGSPLDRPTGPIQFIGRAVKVT